MAFAAIGLSMESDTYDRSAAQNNRAVKSMRE